ncbi:Zinc finger CCCH domain-containing protein 64 [Melia azedarach]|uniref:Zinc finger CCCH domain-containing protein 64 n=1 Tax=Melia azedarach TaxID=155640 RepID=A0ACC1XD11_MELAZ|nr:Zinc finger CCCH domain-containing protein 64 [Melia azedarach]
MAPPRILLCRLNQLFKRVQSVNKSAGPFDALLCVGQFFADSPDRLDEFMDYVEGRPEIPLPTYFIGDYGVGAAKVLMVLSKNSANQGFNMDGIKITNNLFWLKGSGKFTLHEISSCSISYSSIYHGNVKRVQNAAVSTAYKRKMRAILTGELDLKMLVPTGQKSAGFVCQAPTWSHI